MCGKGIENVMIQPFYALHWYSDTEQMNIAVLKFEAKKSTSWHDC